MLKSRHCTKNMVCNINLISYVSLSCVSVFGFLLNIKAVEGSGSEGASKYMGEGVTYGVFLGTLSIFHMHVPTDTPCQWARTVAYVITM